MKNILQSKRARYLLAGTVVLTALISLGAYKAATYKSPEYIKNESEVKRAVVLGWPIKHMASVESNREQVDEFRVQLPKYYCNDKGELTKQQRLITAEIRNTSQKGTFPEIVEQYNTDENQAIIDFRFSDISFEDIRIRKDQATVIAEVEYLIKRRFLTQQYGSMASNKYQWVLKKTNDEWLIVEEQMLSVTEQ